MSILTFKITSRVSRAVVFLALLTCGCGFRQSDPVLTSIFELSPQAQGFVIVSDSTPTNGDRWIVLRRAAQDQRITDVPLNFGAKLRLGNAYRTNTSGGSLRLDGRVLSPQEFVGSWEKGDGPSFRQNKDGSLTVYYHITLNAHQSWATFHISVKS